MLCFLKIGVLSKMLDFSNSAFTGMHETLLLRFYMRLWRASHSLQILPINKDSDILYTLILTICYNETAQEQYQLNPRLPKDTGQDSVTAYSILPTISILRREGKTDGIPARGKFLPWESICWWQQPIQEAKLHTGDGFWFQMLKLLTQKVSFYNTRACEHSRWMSGYRILGKVLRNLV